MITVTVLSGATRTNGLGANGGVAAFAEVNRNSTPMMRQTPVPPAILMKVRRDCWIVMALIPS
jgi:hypothetical protein